jgi:hypothetical protein
MWTQVLIWVVAIAIGLLWWNRRNVNRRNVRH